MIIQCEKCGMYLEDCYRTTVCPHQAFPANDGNNNFTLHAGAYLSKEPPTLCRHCNSTGQVKFEKTGQVTPCPNCRPEEFIRCKVVES